MSNIIVLAKNAKFDKSLICYFKKFSYWAIH